jgi:hypothetical protein
MIVGTSGVEKTEPNLISTGHVIAYGGEVRIKFSPDDHRYLVSDKLVQGGEWLTVPSVTTVLGFMLDRSKFLSPWVGKLGRAEFHEHVLPGIAYSEDQLRKIGFCIRDRHKRVLDEAGRLGHDVHEWLEKYLIARQRGSGFPLPPTDPKVRSCCSGGRQWIVENNVQPLAIEQILFSRKYRVIGTMDLAASLLIDGQPSVCDYKSSQSLHKSYHLQLAAYRAMLREQQGIETTDRWLIHLNKLDGTFNPVRLSRETADREETAFFQLVEAFRSVNDLNFFEQ